MSRHIQVEVCEKLCPQCGNRVELIPGSDMAEHHFRRSYLAGKTILCEHSGQVISGPPLSKRVMIRLKEVK